MKKLYSDEQLIDLLASPERQRVDKAIAQLYKQQKDMVFRLVRTNSGTKQDAEELFDDVLVGLWKSVQDGRYQPTARLKTYLYQLARNTWLNRIRDANRRIKFVDTDEIGEQHSTEQIDDVYDMKETFDAYWERVRAMGDTCYNVLWAFAQGYTMQEIATQFGLGTADNAKTIKYNCLKKAGKPTL